MSTDAELVAAMDNALEKWGRKRLHPTSRIISGGASGADFEWSLAAINANLEVGIMSFPGHSRRVPMGCSVVELDEEVLRETDRELEAVAKDLKRKIPPPGYTRNLLRRNIHIVKNADAVYAVTTLEKGEIPGGTAWGCKHHQLHSPHPQLFLFDMATDKWMRYHDSRWIEEHSPRSPKEFSVCAVIGSRQLSVAGKRAIRDIFNL